MPKSNEEIVKFLIKDEREAIRGYEKAMVEDLAHADIYDHIRKEEEEHIRELEALL